MSDLFTNINSMQANINSSAARKEARRARQAAESIVDGQAIFLLVPVAKFERESVPGLFFKRNKLVGTLKKLSIKNTDVSQIEEHTDHFGNVYSLLLMEDRYDGDSEILVNLTLEALTSLINGVKE